MAQCAFCRAETELYDGGDVPICVECSDAREAKRKPPATEQIRRFLIQEGIEATARASAALGEFNEVMDQFPGGLLDPDRSRRVQTASRKLIAARKELGRARSRLNDYQSRGIVPDDLKRTGS